MTQAPDGLIHLHSGKVRELFRAEDGGLVMLATDRISAFDYVLDSQIPDKGRVLTAMSVWWFAQLSALVPNHLISTDDPVLPEQWRGRALVVAALQMVPVEAVARGYLTGSGLAEYRASGAVCGIELPAGLEDGSRLPQPIFTPATKAQTGHDENIDRAAAVDLVGEERFDEVEATALALYDFVSGYARERGIILADTKLEFGLDEDGRLVLGDEAFTPDSSRFWPADEYAPGGTPPSFDKQFVRDYCESLGWDKTDPGPALPVDVVIGTRARYVEAFEALTGISFDDYLTDPGVVLR
jgi:phosphoribosylaminoimidazole-succinocarboxamide synthase